ncbi:flagellar biosynthesis protein FlhB [Pseudaeromonas sharmana]|uniref:Flagellar biosynthetic protein FlhB n=1 Tax=Pseudaeromonas sharmana TaxID=328412 RepID=A0ABV8CIX2_9GAMM
MAEADGQEKTEDPTGKRLSDAKAKGQIPRSKELGTALVLLAGVIGLYVTGAGIGSALLEICRRNFSFSRDEVFDPETMELALSTDIANLIVPMSGWFFILLLAALIGNLLLGGFNFSSEAMMPKFTKLNPINGLKRMVGVQSLIELVKSIGKVTFIALMVWWLLTSQLPHILDLSQRQFPYAIYDALETCLWIAIGICCALVPIVAIDVPFQKWHHKEQLKMTKQEVKDEYKNSEGKPEVKGRLRRMQYEMANRRMMAEVPKADVIVTNPTHYAVALKYDKQQGKAPVVVAKGVDEIAMMIRNIGTEYGITQVAAPPLARAIFHTTKLDSEIPEGLFVAVAQVLAYVYQLQAYRQGRGQAPHKLADELPIPDELRY